MCILKLDITSKSPLDKGMIPVEVKVLCFNCLLFKLFNAIACQVDFYVHYTIVWELLTIAAQVEI